MGGIYLMSPTVHCDIICYLKILDSAKLSLIVSVQQLFNISHDIKTASRPIVNNLGIQLYSDFYEINCFLNDNCIKFD